MITTYDAGKLGRVTIPDNQVSESDSCPSCGETDADWLVWDDEGETVTCENCGRVYVPGKAF
jgi:uncharacterized OB-fold protein